jgi:hypothetical protein
MDGFRLRDRANALKRQASSLTNGRAPRAKSQAPLAAALPGTGKVNVACQQHLICTKIVHMKQGVHARDAVQQSAA